MLRQAEARAKTKQPSAKLRDGVEFRLHNKWLHL